MNEQSQIATVSPGESVDKKPADGQAQKPDNTAALAREKRLVEQWTKRIKEARKKADPAFRQMREDIRFAKGLQWQGQKKLDDARYVCNMVLRSLNQGVATLYARNPECEAIRRDRLDFAIWDGKLETLTQAQMAFSQATMAGMPCPPLAQAVLEDYSQGEMQRDVVERIGKTTRFVFQYMMDTQQPSFKLQMKQLVRRVKTTGVGYVKINFDDGFEQSLSTSETESTIVDRAQRIAAIAEKLQKGELKEDSPEVATLALLGNSIQQSIKSGDTANVNQRITFDFLPSTSVIVDSRCRHLKGFVGARWIAVQYIYDLDYINAKFESKIKASDIQGYSSTGQELTAGAAANNSDDQAKVQACIWEVYDLDTKTMAYVVDGWKQFVTAPRPVMPELNHFWPVVALTFNDVEADIESGDDCGIYPPSDVQLMRSPQKEINRTREALRNHRIANTPCYMTGKGWLTDSDKEKIINHEESAVIELEGAQIGTEIGKLLAPFQHSPIVPQLYDTTPLMTDIQFTSGEQEANLGRPTPRVTATGANIAEQSKNTVSASNIDDLDDMLSTLAQMGGEIILRYFNIETVKRIAGKGAILPQTEREDYINEINLSVKAASSGRPNKAVNISTFSQVAPLLMQAGANPAAVVEEGVRVMDDRLDVSKFFPIVNPAEKLQMATMAQQQQQSAANGQQKQPTQPQQQNEQPPNEFA